MIFKGAVILILFMLWVLMSYRKLQLKIFILIFFIKLRTTFLQKKLTQEKLISDIRQWHRVRKTKIKVSSGISTESKCQIQLNTLLLLLPQCIYKSLEPKRLRSLAKKQQVRVWEDIQNFQSACDVQKGKKMFNIFEKA